MRRHSASRSAASASNAPGAAPSGSSLVGISRLDRRRHQERVALTIACRTYTSGSSLRVIASHRR
jgi:hypothetical protein